MKKMNTEINKRENHTCVAQSNGRTAYLTMRGRILSCPHSRLGSPFHFLVARPKPGIGC
jgi:hypothetical protein